MNKILCIFAATLVLLAAGCSGNGNGNGDGGQTECGDQYCTSSETCVADAICVPNATSAANACEENEHDLFDVIGPAELGCHNVELCASEDDCPEDDSGESLVCRDGYCGIAAPAGGGLPETVTFRGCIDAFGLSDTTDTMHAALYLGSEDPSGASDWDVAATKDDANCEFWGAFEFEDVPTNTPLILKTYDPQEKFVMTYKYNLVLWADLATDAGGGDWVFDTRASVSDPRTGQEISLDPWRGYAILQSTYDVILMTVGVTLPENAGGIAGTIRDCGYHELQNVRCSTADKAEVLTYFTNAEDPRPDHSRDSTHTNGIYAAINIPAGTHKVACQALNSDGEQVPLGVYSVDVFGHAITILSFDWYPGID